VEGLNTTCDDTPVIVKNVSLECMKYTLEDKTFVDEIIKNDIICQKLTVKKNMYFSWKSIITLDFAER